MKKIIPIKNESDKLPGKHKMNGDDSYKSIMLSGGCKKCGGKTCSCKGGKK